MTIRFPEAAAAVLDVTKPPYDCDPTGTRDCTEALRRLITALQMEVYEAFLDTKRVLSEGSNEYFLGFETGERKGVVFPARTPPPRIVYFPNGVYRLSDTVTYVVPDLQNDLGAEMNRNIHLVGESEDGVVLRLDDNAPGYHAGADKPVLDLMRGTRSNVSMQNSVENLTVEVGADNPGAIGLRFFANNTGAARNVTIRSADPQGAGAVGLAVDRNIISATLFQHLTVDGFDIGIDVTHFRIYTVYEHIMLRNQRIAGMRVGRQTVAIRDLRSHNSCPAIEISGGMAHVVALDCQLERSTEAPVAAAEGLDRTGLSTRPGAPAILHRAGSLLLRNVSSRGYARLTERGDSEGLEGESVDEYVSHGKFSAFDDTELRTLGLPVEDTPQTPWDIPLDQWTSVNDHGAAGDGVTDDTDAFARALASGAAVVYFQPGRYRFDAAVEVPSSVRRIVFMYADLVAGEQLKASRGAGLLRVSGNSSQPLFIEDLFAWEEWYGVHYLVDHACGRTVVLSDLHSQVCGLYRNSVSGGKLFIENCCCTDVSDKRINFELSGQEVWARQLNPERANPEVVNDGGRLWVLGFKTEGKGTSFRTTRGGETEILGGVVNCFGMDERRGGPLGPMLECDDGRLSLSATSNGPGHEIARFEVALRERRSVQSTAESRAAASRAERVLRSDVLPHRNRNLSFMPLIVAGAGAPSEFNARRTTGTEKP